MWKVAATEQSIGLDSQFTLGEVNYPPNWLRHASPEERSAIGLIEVADPEPTPPPVQPAKLWDWVGFQAHCFTEIFAADSELVSRLIDRYPSFIIGIQTQNLSIVQAVVSRAGADYTLDATQGISQVTADAILAAIVVYRLDAVRELWVTR